MLTKNWVRINNNLEANTLYASLQSVSDRRLKKEVQNLKHSLEKINKLHAVSFKWKDPAKGQGLHLGFIAQEVKPLIPEVVTRDRKNFLNINYPALVPVLTQALQELHQWVKTQFANIKEALSSLTKQITGIKEVLSTFKKQFTDIKTKLNAFKKQFTGIREQLSVFKKTFAILKQQRLSLKTAQENFETRQLQTDKDQSIKIQKQNQTITRQNKKIELLQKKLLETQTQMLNMKNTLRLMQQK